ncbi:hypothetical protein [Daejeonella oryzae]|uniref:hypothetical protein n=1 Tax=Daejeonella oryzae TaxID=1122943 RepID=UPI0003FCDDF7|nr:hypothetical protein [Daejeonella oryzae]
MKTLENQSKTAENKIQTNAISLNSSISNGAKNGKVETEKKDPESSSKALEQGKSQEEDKTEIRFEKPALNLESTLKLVVELHRRKIQRDKLLETIETLEAFEVAQKEDAEETDSNHFQGCVLTIEDDTRRKFTTKNPVIIFSVAQYVNSMCINRLAEIEAGITIPA